MESLKTITFEDGKQYAVNAPVYEINGELAEASETIDFGTFPEGLTEFKFIMNGASSDAKDYYHLVINGVRTSFIISGTVFNGVWGMTINKVGNLWHVSGGSGNASSYAASALKNVEHLTSFAVQAYENSVFDIGHKYAMEAR